jgi:hypothetical protein
MTVSLSARSAYSRVPCNLHVCLCDRDATRCAWLPRSTLSATFDNPSISTALPSWQEWQLGHLRSYLRLFAPLHLLQIRVREAAIMATGASSVLGDAISSLSKATLAVSEDFYVSPLLG